MHAYLTEVLARLDDSRVTLARAVDAVPEVARRLRPTPDRWSVAEVLEHLAKVNYFFAERIANSIADARGRGLGPETGAREPLPADVSRKMADRGERREAREAVFPTGAVDTAAAWEDLERSRDAVRKAAATGDGLALGTVTAEHRLFGLLNIYQWIELTAAHEERHADQIREIGDAVAVVRRM